jgi:hypothetical protein
MVKRIIKESLIEARFCDLCNKRIPKRNHRSGVTEYCIWCRKDCCYECQIQLRKKIKVGTYHYTTVTYGVICKKCCKRLKIPITEINK